MSRVLGVVRWRRKSLQPEAGLAGDAHVAKNAPKAVLHGTGCPLANVEPWKGFDMGKHFVYTCIDRRWYRMLFLPHPPCTPPCRMLRTREPPKKISN